MPTGYKVESGNATFDDSQANSLTIKASDHAIINFDSFSIGANESVRFLQPDSSASVLSRVTGNGSSDIFGSLFANGEFVLVNPNGIHFGPQANVQVGSLIASTLNIQNSMYLANQYAFQKQLGSNPGSIFNEANIQVAHGGHIAFLADKSIKNTGALIADYGSVALGIGDRQTISFDNGFINLAIDKGSMNAIENAIDNQGLIKADGGKILLTAKTLNEALFTLINNKGIIKAKKAVEHNGIIELVATGGITSKGSLMTDYLLEEGANFKIGGTFDVAASYIRNLDHAMTFADNTTLSGTISDLENIVIETGVTITLSGDTTFWADRDGNGAGAFLMDYGATIIGNNHNLTLRAGENSTIGALSGVDVLTLDTSGPGVDPVTFTGQDHEFAADNDIHVNTFYTKYGVSFEKNVGAGDEDNPYLIYDISQLSTHVILNSGVYTKLANNINASATRSYNDGWGMAPIGYMMADFSGVFDGDNHTIAHLYQVPQVPFDSIGLFGGLSGATVQNLNLTDVNVGGNNFIGAIAGSATNHTLIENVTVTGVVNAHNRAGGLVGSLGDHSVIQNSHASVDITGNNFVGGLAGQVYYYSEIDNSYSTGIISGSNRVGGLTGYLNASSSISNSYATGNVIATASLAGGLVGEMQDGSSITRSYATGDVSGGQVGTGGLVGGMIGSTISKSYATGTVNGAAYTGGFVGYMFSGSGIDNAYAAGNVEGTDYTGGFVGYMTGASTIDNTYATGNVKGTGTWIGGYAGSVQGSSTVTDSFTTSSIDDSSGTNIGGFAGYYDGQVDDNNWYYNAQALAYFDGAGGEVTKAASALDFFDPAHDVYNYFGSEWNISNSIGDNPIWAMSGNLKAYPLLAFRMAQKNGSNVYQIKDTYQLQLMFMDLAGIYALANDIDAQQTQRWNQIDATTFLGFESIGSDTDRFTGNFDGDNHVISNLNINRPEDSLIGIFAVTNGSTLSNVGLDNFQISGGGAVGAMVGSMYNTKIDNVYSAGEGSLQGAYSYVGGLAGLARNHSTISNSYNEVAISGGDNVGGLVGYASGYITIDNSYSAGAVTSVGDNAGGLVGYIEAGSMIKNSHATGDVTGTTSVGGLVGETANSFISNSYASSGRIYGDHKVGGLVGLNGNTLIENSYTDNTVKVSMNVENGTGGGLVGTNAGGTIRNSYAKGSVSLDDEAYDDVVLAVLGGLIGLNTENGTLEDSYSSAAVDDHNDATEHGGLVGRNDAGSIVTNSFWDIQTSTQTQSSGSADYYGLNTAAMEFKSIFVDAGWDFNGLWQINANEDPHLVWEDMAGGGTKIHPWEITNVNQLQFMMYDRADQFKLVNDIDATDTKNWNYDLATNTHLGFTPIGDGSSPYTTFYGLFDGQSHTISNLKINRPSLDNVALFGFAYNAAIDNVYLKNVDIKGNNQTGALVGTLLNSSLTNSSASGTVVGNTNVGGLVGNAEFSSVETSFSAANVTGNNLVGGLVGSSGHTQIENVYASGNVSSQGRAGGLVAYNYNFSSIDNAFAIGNVSGSDGTGGFVGVNRDHSQINHSYSTGNVTYSGAQFGGFVGVNDGNSIIKNSFTTSYVTGLGGQVGGFAGYQTGTLENDYFNNNLNETAVGNGDSAGVTGGAIDFSRNDAAVYNGMDPWLVASNPSDNAENVWVILNHSNSMPLLRFRYSTTIKDATQLELMGFGPSAAYTLGANVDASETAKWNSDGQDGHFGFLPIQNFSGSFDGNGHTISGLTIARPSENNVGLINNMLDGSSLKNIGLLDVNISGHDIVGALVANSYGSAVIENAYVSGGSVSGADAIGGLIGQAHDASVINNSYSKVDVTGTGDYTGGFAGIFSGNMESCYFDGVVDGQNYTGGLAGFNYGNIKNSYSAGTVGGTRFVGGAIGYMSSGSTLSQSFSSADVSGGDDEGGLVGLMTFAIVNNVFSSGSVHGGNFVGGLIGSAHYGGEIDNSFAVGHVVASGQRGGLVGYDNGGAVAVSNSFWDMQTTGLDFTDHDMGTGLNTVDLKNTATFPSGSGWDFNGLWKINSGEYAHLVWQDMKNSTNFIGGTSDNPFKIHNVNELQFMRHALSDSFVLANDIDASIANPDHQNWNDGAGFTPIGDADFNSFTGSLDGQGHTISNLFINAGNYTGLIGGARNAAISNINLTNVDITGNNFVGSLIGYAIENVKIDNASASGVVRGSSDVGGLAGGNQGYSSINHSHASVDVYGLGIIGGLVGYNYQHASIDNSYATGAVHFSGWKAGGLVGSNYNFSSIDNSYATGNVQTTLDASGGGHAGGLVGYNALWSTIDNSYATGNVSSKGISVGGLVGYQNQSRVSNAFALGNVDSTGQFVGGFVGNLTYGSMIENSYSSGNVSGGDGSTGGFVGYASNSKIVNSFAANNHVTATSGPGQGGFIGTNDGGNVFINNWWFNDKALDGTDGDLEGVTKADAITDFFDSTKPIYTNNDAGTSWSISNSPDASTWAISSMGKSLPLLQFRYSTTIADAIQLQLMYLNLAATYSLADDIDVSITQQMNPDGNGGYYGFEPIGHQTIHHDYGDYFTQDPFTGKFYGFGHTITGLTIDRSEDGNVGLFKLLDAATIQDVGLVDVAITGGSTTGAIAGNSSDFSVIKNSYATGTVHGTGSTGGLMGAIDHTQIESSYFAGDVIGDDIFTGGLVGDSEGHSVIHNSYATGTVTGVAYTGGLVGRNLSFSSIDNSYSSSTVEGTGFVGGLVGINQYHSSIDNSYATGNVHGTLSNLGGFLGSNNTGSHVNGSFSTGTVIGDSGFLGGFVGFDDVSGSYAENFFNRESNPTLDPIGSTGAFDSDIVGKTIAELKTQSIFTDAGWDFNGLWKMNNGEYAHLIWQDMNDGNFTGGTEAKPFQINNVNQLQFMKYSNSDYFVLANDIDASMTPTWNNADGVYLGFDPIGATGSEFTGILDGQNYTITGLYINRDQDNVGLFGKTDGATIKNLNLADADITGNDNTGALVGYATGQTISRVSVSVGSTVAGSTNVGGLVGYSFNHSSIEHSSSSADVEGSILVGGLVGYNKTHSTISDSHASGKVSNGFGGFGGLVGWNEDYSLITGSYATGDVSGAIDIGGLVGKNLSGSSIKSSYATGDISGSVHTGGFVGYNDVGSFIDNSYATGNVKSRGDDTGGLVGRQNQSVILRSFATGDVIGQINTGGLVGINQNSGSRISNAYATGNVHGSNYVGGLVGVSQQGSEIDNSYAMGDVRGTGDFGCVGGFIGWNAAYSHIGNSYSTGVVTGSHGWIGGFAGANEQGSSIANSFTVSKIVDLSDGSEVGGFAGYNDSDGLTNTWWFNSKANGVGSDSGDPQIVGKWQKADLASDFFDPTHSVYSGWNVSAFHDGAQWGISSERGKAFPLLQFRYSTNITDATQLQLMMLDLGASYTLANDIDASETSRWNSGFGFEPVGLYSNTPFSGTFNGNDHVITGLTIDRPNTWFVGLFGAVKSTTDQAASISNVTLQDVDITGYNYVGGLVGQDLGFVGNHSLITHAGASGQVHGHNYVGGLVGDGLTFIDISDSYSEADVLGYQYVGGFIGGLSDHASISSCFAEGNVVASNGEGSPNQIGGFAGYSVYHASIDNSYARGNVTSLVDNTFQIGGFVGENVYIATIDNCYATGNVVAMGASSSGIGGFAGGNESYGGGASINHSFSTGSVMADRDAGQVGGFVGRNRNGELSHDGWVAQSELNAVGYDTVLDSSVKYFSADGNPGYISGYDAENVTEFYNSGHDIYSAWSFSDKWIFPGGNDKGFALLRGFYSTNIRTLVQLQLMSMDLTADYTLGNDIDASASAHWNPDGQGGYLGFVPVGAGSFTGSLDGQFHAISNLTINRPNQNFVGLFGSADGGAQISNVGLLNANITGADGVGGFVGVTDGDLSISKSYVTGAITSTGNAESIFGTNGVAGGLIGLNFSESFGEETPVTISQSYFSGSVTADYDGSGGMGGLVGFSIGNLGITDSYALGEARGSVYVGGLIGLFLGSLMINNSYSAVKVTGTDLAAGLVGSAGSGDSYSNVYWLKNNGFNEDLAAVGDSGYPAGTTAMTGSQMADSSNFAGFDFSSTWFETGHPFLRWEYSKNISNVHQLQLMAMDLSADYKIAKNIDASETSHWNYDGSLAGGIYRGFKPVGDGDVYFGGSLNGKNHVVSNFYSNRPDESYVALFGTTGSNVNIENVGLADAYVSGNIYTAGLVAYDAGALSITKSYVMGSVIAGSMDFGPDSGNYAGGLIAYVASGSNARIEQSYFSGTVNGFANVGGLVGENRQNLWITDSYALGEIFGSANLGGLVGETAGVLTVQNSYAAVKVPDGENVGGLVGYDDGDSSYDNVYWLRDDVYNQNLGPMGGHANPSGTANLTGAEMSDMSNFSGFDFDNVWTEVGHPFLQWEYSKNISNLHQLQLMATNLTAYYTLSNDIDASETAYWNYHTSGFEHYQGFAPVGNDDEQFSGMLNGNNHTISHLFINRPYQNNVGLFGTLESNINSNAAVWALALQDVNITGRMYVGSLAGKAQGFANGPEGDYTDIHRSTIFNVSADGTVEGTQSAVGGLVGTNDLFGQIFYSSANAQVSGPVIVGGLAGNNFTHSMIWRSYAKGDASGNNSVGGLVGGNLVYSTISESYATGNVTATGNTPGSIGGLAGYNFLHSTIDNSYAKGNVTSTISGSAYIGGFAGYNGNYATIDNSYSTGNITATGSGSYNIGSFVGYNSSDINHSFETGTVTVGDGAYQVGGFVGSNYGTLSSDGWVIQEGVDAIGYDAGLDSSVGRLSADGNPGYISGYDETSAAAFYGSSHAIYSSWDFESAPVWDSFSSNAPHLHWEHFVMTGFSISGNLYDDSLTIVGAGYHVNLMSGGVVIATAVSDSSGGYLFTGVDFTSGTPFLIYYTGESIKGNALSIADGSSIAGLNVYGSTVTVSHADGIGHTTNADFASAKGSSSDSDILFSVASSNLTLNSGVALHLDTAKTYTPGGNVSAHSFILDNLSTFNAEANTITDYGSWLNQGTFNAGTSTVNFSGVSGDFTINSGASSFYNVTIGGHDNLYSLDTNGMTVTHDFTQNNHNGSFGASPSLAFSVGHSFSLTDGKFYRFGGSGNEGSPFLIYDVYGLQAMSGFLDKYFQLANNIDAATTQNWSDGAGFAPIGDVEHNSYFEGSFDGQSHTISNLYIHLPATNSVGLFLLIDENGRVSDTNLENVDITGADVVGALAGQNYGSVSGFHVTGDVAGSTQVGGLIGRNGGMISDSSVVGTVSGGTYTGGLVGINYGAIDNSYTNNEVSGGSFVGGLVGYNGGATISDSHAIGIVNGGGNYIGGLVGYNHVANILNSYASGNVTNIDDRAFVGGFVGQNLVGNITNSYAEGTVTAGNDTFVGGFVGNNTNSSQILYSYALGDVNGANLVGGFAGNNDTGSSISECFASGNVTAIGTNVGGFAGLNYLASIDNSYATGSVEGADWVGGFVGMDDDGGVILNSYSSGHVTGHGDFTGAFEGIHISSDNFNNFFDQSVNPTLSGSSDLERQGITGISTNQMIRRSTFTNAGWDFDSIWTITEGSSYPYFMWQNDHHIPAPLVIPIEETSVTTAAFASTFALQKSIDANSQYMPANPIYMKLRILLPDASQGEVASIFNQIQNGSIDINLADLFQATHAAIIDGHLQFIL